MPKKIHQVIHSYWPVIGLFVLVFILFVSNYTPGTWLTGWDTLHPEFDFSLNISRVISGVWRQEQGVGDVAIHSHMAELPRILELWILSLLVPTSMLRYLYVFLCLFVGPWGMYVFLQSIFKTKTVSFVAAGAYLLNITVLQHVFIPFEMFPTQFAFLPWFFFFSNKIIERNKLNDWIGLSIVAFLSAPQAYAATLFYAFLMCYGMYAVAYVLSQREDRMKSLKRFVGCGALILSVNAFWLLPNIYSIRTQSTVVENSRINEQFSQEAFLRNKDYGKVGNVLMQNSFLFSWRIYNFQNNTFEELLTPWKKYLSTTPLTILQAGVVGLYIAGIVPVLRKRKPEAVAMLALTGLAMFFLINENPPTGGIYALLQKISLFREGFRMPFTKFSIIYLFGITYLLAYTLYALDKIILKIGKHTYIRHMFSLGLAGALVVLMLPAFQGNLISPKLRITIPQEYFEMFDWFKQKPQGKIVKLPVNTMWGWTYTSWGYQGSGFAWFGIPQPQFDRDFDRWSVANENFYREISKTVRDQDTKGFQQILEKYDVSYVLLDDSVINAGEPTKNPDANKKFLDQVGVLTKVKTLGSISMYETKKMRTEGLTEVENTTLYTQDDRIYKDSGPYIKVKNAKEPLFDGITDERNRIPFAVDANEEYLSAIFPLKTSEKWLTIPAFTKSQDQIPAKIFAKTEKNTVSIQITGEMPKIIVNGVTKYGGDVNLYEETFSINKTLPAFLQIDKHVYPFVPQSEFTEVAKTMLPIKKPMTVAIYAQNEVPVTGFVDAILTNQVSECANPENKIPLITGSRSFSLTVAEKSLCIGAVLPIPTESLLSVKLQTTSKDYITPKFCVIPEGQTNCLDNPKPETYISFAGIRDEKYLLPVPKGDHWFSFVAQGGEGKPRTITYDDIQVETHPAIMQKQVVVFPPTEDDETILKGIPEGQTITVQIPWRLSADESFDRDRGNAQAVNCDVDKIGSVKKIRNGIGVTYTGENGGVSCDYYDYPQIDHAEGYLLRIKGENLAGRSIKYYLQNQKTGVFDTEEVLPAGTFDTLYPILPSSDAGKGYVINLESRSFGSVNAVNTLEKIQIASIPYTWLRNIALVPASETKKINANIEFSQRADWLYKGKPKTKGDIAVFNQGFDQGWVAVQGSTVLPHTKVNGWANGWTIQDDSQDIVLIYLPQLLEFLGFIPLFLLVGVGIWQKSREEQER